MEAPPTFQAIDGEFRSVVGYSHRHVTGIMSDIVDTERYSHTFRIIPEVRLNFDRFSDPGFSLAPVVSDEFLLFGIDANDRKRLAKILSLQSSDVSELFVTVRVLHSSLSFLVSS